MPPPMMRRTRRVSGTTDGAFLLRAPRWRLEMFQHLVAGFFRRLAQDDANFVFHRAALPRSAQAQQPLELIVELPDGETGHSSRIAES